MIDLLISILIGAISGWLAGELMKSRGGLFRNIILGIIGGFVGGMICNFLKVSFYGYLGTVLVSVVGACVVIFLFRLIVKK